MSVDAATGTPDNVARTDGFLTGPSRASATSIATGYVTANADVFGLDSADLATFSSAKTVTDTHGVRHVSWTQSYNGVEVFGNGLRAHVAKERLADRRAGCARARPRPAWPRRPPAASLLGDCSPIDRSALHRRRAAAGHGQDDGHHDPLVER